MAKRVFDLKEKCSLCREFQAQFVMDDCVVCIECKLQLLEEQNL